MEDSMILGVARKHRGFDLQAACQGCLDTLGIEQDEILSNVDASPEDWNAADSNTRIEKLYTWLMSELA